MRELITEVVGLSPYEKRLLDILKTGGVASEKKMYKLAKKRVSCSLFVLAPAYLHRIQLGTHKRAISKRDQVRELFSDELSHELGPLGYFLCA